MCLCEFLCGCVCACVSISLCVCDCVHVFARVRECVLACHVRVCGNIFVCG